MNRSIISKLTLSQPAAYQITVPGVSTVNWSEWVDGMNVEVKNEEGDLSVTVLTCTVDQAALHSLLRRLYSLGLPLISVICVGTLPLSE